MSDPAPRAAAALPGAPSTALCTDLAGKAAVLTGAAGGIGRAIAQALLARGATVHGLDHRAEALEQQEVRHHDRADPAVPRVPDHAPVRPEQFGQAA